ncbi:MAG: hypothetical protein L0312_20210 [Acidobacteria bacterium]|nr:hypothetical protein [Acidobacteriota bacterium]
MRSLKAAEEPEERKSSHRPGRRARLGQKRIREHQGESLQELLQRLTIPNNWDFILVGDGSGSNWNRACGWGCVSIEKLTMERLVWEGGLNRGTVNFAEIMAYIQPLNWLVAREAERRSKHQTRRNVTRIHIVTDSQYCRNTGSSSNRNLPRNSALWSLFDIFTRHGFLLYWHWIPRDDVVLNTYVDQLAKFARQRVEKYNLQERLETSTSDGVVRTVYELNPSEV